MSNIYEKIMRSLNGEEVFFTPTEEARRERLMYILELKLEKVWLNDYKMYNKVKAKMPTVTYPQVLQDIGIVERMIAHEKDPHGDPQKVWYRYFITQVAMESIRIAKEKNDPYTMSVAANIIGRHWQTDKEDTLIPQYDRIVPFRPELTFDPGVIGIKRTENIETVRAELREKYNIDAQKYMKTIAVRNTKTAEEQEETTEDDGD